MPRVLIVEDNLDGAEVLELFLIKHGYEITTVPNGREALAALTGATPPDVVLLDLRMPEMDGLQFLQVIRSYLRWSSLPVIIVTAYADDALPKRVQALGVTHIFQKAALDLEALRSAIEQSLPGLDTGGGD
jgi:CheY-like chemotaxis protein